MKNRFSALLTLLVCSTLLAHMAYAASPLLKKVKKAAAIEVVYQNLSKGKLRPEKQVMTVAGTEVALRDLEEDPSEDRTGWLVTAKFQDWSRLQTRNVAFLPSGRVINTSGTFRKGEGHVKQLEDEEVLGIPCHVYRYSVRSNTYDVWWTDALTGFCGSPQLMNDCVPEGLVLKVVRNGDATQEAAAINVLKEKPQLFPETWGEELDYAEYQYACNHCYDINVEIFDQQAVKFSGEKLPEVASLKEGVQYSAGGGTIILKKVKLPANARDREVFATLTQYSVGDAYDRTGSVFVVPTGKEKSFLDAMHDLKSVPAFRSGDTDYHGLVSTPAYDVPLELMRFFTGFGVRQFNSNKVPGQDWVDSVTYQLNITPLVEHLQGEAWIGAYIGNWDANGHRISLRLTYHPGYADPENVRHALPLFNTTNLLEQDGQPYPIFMLDDNLKASFHLDRPVRKAVLYYISTGHGGWGNGDEFNQKVNTISLDGRKITDFIPWRDDCGTFRNNSPCSGNFSNGLASSDLSRSNWCPGTLTNPEYIYLGDLEAGDHVITIDIPQGAPEGGSNSYWCISGTLLYYDAK